MPEELAIELQRNPQALGLFKEMPPSHRREYARVVGEAKKPETRVKLAAQAIAMIFEWGQRRSG
jgi:uncharacterized protein YdeI (YjbR/CyaY-like superfamily)